LACAARRGVRDLGVFEKLDVQLLEVILCEGGDVWWDTDEELRAGCDLGSLISCGLREKV